MESWSLLCTMDTRQGWPVVNKVKVGTGKSIYGQATDTVPSRTVRRRGACMPASLPFSVRAIAACIPSHPMPSNIHQGPPAKPPSGIGGGMGRGGEGMAPFGSAL